MDLRGLLNTVYAYITRDMNDEQRASVDRALTPPTAGRPRVGSDGIAREPVDPGKLAHIASLFALPVVE